MEIKVKDLADLANLFDPEAVVMVPCAVEDDGTLSLTKDVNLAKGEGEEFSGLDDDGQPEFDEQEYLILMPGEGPWKDGTFKLPDDGDGVTPAPKEG